MLYTVFHHEMTIYLLLILIFSASTSVFLDAGPPSKASRDGRLNAGQLGGVSGAPSARKRRRASARARSRHATPRTPQPRPQWCTQCMHSGGRGLHRVETGNSSLDKLCDESSKTKRLFVFAEVNRVCRHRPPSSFTSWYSMDY